MTLQDDEEREARTPCFLENDSQELPHFFTNRLTDQWSLTLATTLTLFKLD